MARRSKRPEWTPSPASEAAYDGILATAHRCAAALTGERPSENPGADASPQALMFAMGMMFFLSRIDPADLAAFTTGPGSIAELPFGEAPAPRADRASPFAAMFQ